MKFLHTSDWHLGARLGDYTRLAEQKEVLAEIRETAEHEGADFIIIAGDIFDNFNPPNEAVELLYRELKKLADSGRRPVIVLAGNHDSPDRIEAPDPLAAECGIFFIGYPDSTGGRTELDSGTVVASPEAGFIILDMPGKPEVRIIATPYANENRLRRYLAPENREEQISSILGADWSRLAGKYCDDKGVNILTAHLFMADNSSIGELFAETKVHEDEPDEERSILHPGGLEIVDASLVPPQVQYTALGHLHRPQTVRKGNSPVVYSGSPLAFGLSEENQQKMISLVEVEPGGAAEVEFAPLNSGRRILRKTFPGIDEAVEWLTDNPDVYVELLIECEKYISAAGRRRLFAAHDGITTVIPVSRSVRDDDGDVQAARPDLTESMEELFKSFFEYSRGTEPGPELLELFREVAAVPADGEAEARDEA